MAETNKILLDVKLQGNQDLDKLKNSLKDANTTGKDLINTLSSLKTSMATTRTVLDSLSVGLKKLEQTFKPEYAALGILGFGADIEFEAKRRFGGEEAEKAIRWWSEYNRLQAPNRHALFGATLTGNELKNYANVHVGNDKNGFPKFKKQHVSTDKSLEENLRILLQKGRSCGFRVIAATQRASVKVITGDAKVNFPVQVCFRVQKEVDSKVVLDESGAETLQGNGDGLIKSPEYLDTIRFQAFYKP